MTRAQLEIEALIDASVQLLESVRTDGKNRTDLSCDEKRLIQGPYSPAHRAPRARGFSSGDVSDVYRASTTRTVVRLHSSGRTAILQRAPIWSCSTVGKRSSTKRSWLPPLAPESTGIHAVSVEVCPTTSYKTGPCSTSRLN